MEKRDITGGLNEHVTSVDFLYDLTFTLQKRNQNELCKTTKTTTIINVIIPQ